MIKKDENAGKPRMKAVIPAAGWGTRFLPATKAQPKEMLPVVDRPTIQYVVEEAVAAGIDDLIIITGHWKRAIEDHFDRGYELESLLKAKQKKELLSEIYQIINMADIHYIRQKEQKGLGDAIYCAKKHIMGEPFAVLLGDDIIASQVPCTRQLMDVHVRTGASVIALERQGKANISRYGVISGKPVEGEGGRLWKIDDMVEKPPADKAPSDLAIMGRYILTPEIFECLKNAKPSVAGEIQITDAILRLHTEMGQDIYGYIFEGKRYDIGSKIDWIKANIELALKRPEFKEELTTFIKETYKGL